MTDADDETPTAKVRKAMAGRKRVTADEPKTVRRGGTRLTVHEGGKGEAKPKRSRRKAAAPEEPYALYGDAPPAGDPAPPQDGGEAPGPFDGAGEGQPPEGTTPEDLEKARQCAELDQNDRDNARRLIIWSGPDIVYVSGMGWLTWRSTHWQRDEGDLGARLLGQNIVDKIKLEAALLKATPLQQHVLDSAARLAQKPEPTPADEKIMRRAEKILEQLALKRSRRHAFAVSTGNAAKTSAMLTQAASLKNCAADALDANLRQFNVKNGTLVFEREENPDSDPDAPTYGWVVRLKPHSRADMITKCADVAYDPAASCPRFDAFLAKTQPAEAMRLFLQVMHGYALLIGGNDEQRLVYHYGTGANGKSAFMEAIGRLAGDYRAVVSPDTITGDVQRDGSKANSDIARLHSTRLATIEELPRGVSLKENLIKALTGGTRMVARFLQKEIFEFDPIFTAVLSGNDMPTVGGTDYGIWRRLLIVHWAVTIAEADRIPFGELMQAFDAERPGILNWLLAGALRYLNEGLPKFIPVAVTAFTDEYREERDPVGSFVEACVLRGEGFEHLKVAAADMYKAYTEWCEANAIKPYQQTAFGLRLNALGIKKKRGHKVYYMECWLNAAGTMAPPEPEPGDPGWSPE
jgi:putative DNA primase/helicase